MNLKVISSVEVSGGGVVSGAELVMLGSSDDMSVVLAPLSGQPEAAYTGRRSFAMCIQYNISVSSVLTSVDNCTSVVRG